MIPYDVADDMRGEIKLLRNELAQIAVAVEIAIEELDAVEREIGVPSKALPLLRALRTEGLSQ